MYYKSIPAQNAFQLIYSLSSMSDLDEECHKADLEEVFMKYGPLKEIWLASYAPYYAFVVFRDRMDAQVCSLVMYFVPWLWYPGCL